MLQTRAFTDQDIDFLRDLFHQTINLASSIYGEHIFRPWDSDSGNWSKRPQIALADAVMVASSAHLDIAGKLADRRQEILGGHQDPFFSKRLPPEPLRVRGIQKAMSKAELINLTSSLSKPLSSNVQRNSSRTVAIDE